MADISDDDLLSELGINLAPVKQVTYTAKEERIISGFEEIIQFYEINQRIPSSSNNADIFERLYAVRLDQLRKLPEAVCLLENFDQYNLLNSITSEPSDISELEDDDLLSELGIEIEDEHNILILNNVRSSDERKEAELIGKQKVCEDFAVFKPLFEQIQKDLDTGTRYTKRYGKNNVLEKNDWFILNGQLVYIAEITEYFEMSDGHLDARTRLIYSNGTESNILMRSLTKSLYKDETGRRVLITNNTGTLSIEENLPNQEKVLEIKSGTIYVLRSLSSNPFILGNKQVIHKIGVTTGKVNQRITEARKDPTYLLADVELVATYSLPKNIVPQKLEKLIHKVLKSAQLDIVIEDRFGNPVKPKEWFLVSLNIINDIIDHIKNGSIETVYYDAGKAQLISIS
ncbi:GIY-YIG nuclease family protein [Providencia rettgeri]|nr:MULTISPECIES: GIY-YIG nuclease family protein [Morganellaceae]ELR5188792.1 GIY-YIG nuclease family protein [Providencia rettgeri]MBG5985004.1 GIY-YIG nuclease family protein [Proteus vulgaris]MBJ9973428.1 GIY-YIG nuclease family protein [Providencia rettgeri]MBN7840479.1 GIY-YIG nuclease family protein [Providencia rettgeri]MBN7852207.1 GIY-YIG nuclease family protein [Providencia rettgeri]